MAQSAQQVLQKVLSMHALSFLWIPLGVLVITHLIQARFKTRPGTGMDLFAFTLALDMTLIANSGVATRINPMFQQNFVQVFMVGWIVSMIMLTNAARVQAKIGAGTRKARYYPAEQVGICWICAFVIVSFHLYAILGG